MSHKISVVLEGLFYLDLNLSPYEGSTYHQPPLVLAIGHFLRNDTVLTAAFFIGIKCDGYIILLYAVYWCCLPRCGRFVLNQLCRAFDSHSLGIDLVIAWLLY